MNTSNVVPVDIQLACQTGLMNFMAHFDADEFEAMQAWFAPNGTWIRADGTIKGLDNLRIWAAERKPGHILVRHLISNLRFETLPEGLVRIHSYVTVYRHDGQPGDARPAPMNGPALVGRYTDDMVLHEGRWKIYHKSVQIDFKTNLS